MTTTTITLPAEVVADDHRLDETAEAGKSAEFERDRLRWEWTRCPLGPRLSYAEYGRQVGRSRDTITRSAKAYAEGVSESSAALQTDTPECMYGKSHDPAAVAAAEPAKPTAAERAAHSKAKHRLTAGERGALVIETLCALTGYQANTIEHNATWTPLQQAARARVNAEVADDAEAADAEEQVKAITIEVYEAHKHDEEAAKRVQKWMATNRGPIPADKPRPTITDARKMVDRIWARAKRKDITFAEAEAEQREWDHKGCKADRIENEMLAKARRAVLELREAASRAKDASRKVVECARDIEANAIPITDDERTLVTSDLEAAGTAVALARGYFTGVSGTNWDDEMRRLLDETGDRS